MVANEDIEREHRNKSGPKKFEQDPDDNDVPLAQSPPQRPSPFSSRRLSRFGGWREIL